MQGTQGIGGEQKYLTTNVHKNTVGYFVYFLFYCLFFVVTFYSSTNGIYNL